MSQKELTNDCEHIKQSQVKNWRRNETKTEKKEKKKMVKSESQSAFTEKHRTRSKYRLAARVAAEALKKTACTRLHKQTQQKNKITKSRKRLKRKTTTANSEILYRFEKQSNPEEGDKLVDDPLDVTQVPLNSNASSCENCSEIDGQNNEDIKRLCNNQKIKDTLEKEMPCLEELSNIKDNEYQSLTSTLKTFTDENIENNVTKKRKYSEHRSCQEEYSKNEDNKKQSLSSNLPSYNDENEENVVSTKKRRCSQEKPCQEEFSKVDDDENGSLTSPLQSCTDKNEENVATTPESRYFQEKPCQEEFSKVDDDKNGSLTSPLQSCTDKNAENVVSTMKRRCSQEKTCQEEFAKVEDDETGILNSALQSCIDENVENVVTRTKKRKFFEDKTCQEEFSVSEVDENHSFRSTLQSCTNQNEENVNVIMKEGRHTKDKPCQEEFSKSVNNKSHSLSSTFQICNEEIIENVVITKKRRHSFIDLTDIDLPGKCQNVSHCNDEVVSDSTSNMGMTDAKQTDNRDSNVQNLTKTNSDITDTVDSLHTSSSIVPRQSLQSNASISDTGSAHSEKSDQPSKYKRKRNVRTVSCQTKHTHLPTDNTICEFCQKPCSLLSKPIPLTVTPPRPLPVTPTSNQNASVLVVPQASPVVAVRKTDPPVIPVKKFVSVLPAPPRALAPGTVVKIVNTASPGVFQVYVPPNIRFPNGIATLKLQQQLQHVASPGPSFSTVQLNNTSGLSGSGLNPSVQNATNIRGPTVAFVGRVPQSEIKQLLMRPRGPTATPQRSIAPLRPSKTLGCSTRVTQATAVSNVYSKGATVVNQRLNIQNVNLQSLPANSQIVHTAVKSSGFIAVPSSGPLTALSKITNSLKPTNAIKQVLATYSLNQKSDWNTCDGQWSIAEVLEHIINSDFLISADLLGGIDEGTNTCGDKSVSIDGLLECLLCGGFFVNINLFENHVRLHKINGMASKEGQVVFSGSEKPFTCALCQMKFVYLYDLAKHRFIHRQKHSNGVLIHQCSQCNKRFSLQSQLVVHRILNHEDDVMTKCFTCGRQHREADQLLKHIQRVHLGSNSLQKTSSCLTNSKQSGSARDKQVSVAVSLNAISAISSCVAPTANAVMNGVPTAKLTARNEVLGMENVCGSRPSSGSDSVNIVMEGDTRQGNLSETSAADTNQRSPFIPGGNKTNGTSTQNEAAQQKTLPGQNSDDQMAATTNNVQWKGGVSGVLYRCSVCNVKFETAREFVAHCKGCRSPSARTQRKCSRFPYSNVSFGEQSHDVPSHINCQDNSTEKIVQNARKSQEKSTTSISEPLSENLCQSSLSSNTKLNHNGCRNVKKSSISESLNENLHQKSLSSNAKANQNGFRNGYKCYSCKVAFKTALELATHIRQSQDFESGCSATDGRKFECRSCKLTFRNAADLASHISNYKIIVRKKATEKSDLGNSMGKTIDASTNATVGTQVSNNCNDKLSGNASNKLRTDLSKNAVSKVVTNLDRSSGGLLPQTAATEILECNYKNTQHLCRVCKREFSLMSELLAHLDATHCGLKDNGSKSAPKLICKVCDKRFHTAGGLIDHFRKHQQL